MALVAVLILPLFAAVFAVAQGESALPMCCRRDGMHHCMEMMSAESSGAPKLRIHCPSMPRSAAVPQTGAWNADATPHIQTGLLTTSARIGQVEAGYRLSSIRTRQKRGPPTQSS